MDLVKALDWFESSVGIGVVLAILMLVLLYVAALLTIAFRSGRRVTFFPPKIGPRLVSSHSPTADIRGDPDMTWPQVEAGVEAIVCRIESDQRPTVLLTVSGSGSIVANLVMKRLRYRPPVLNVQLERHSPRWPYSLADHEVVEAARWRVHIPNAVVALDRAIRIAMVDSTCLTGDTVHCIRRFLEAKGFRHVLVACLVDVSLPEKQHRPDFAVSRRDSADFSYPWGPAN